MRKMIALLLTAATMGASGVVGAQSYSPSKRYARPDSATTDSARRYGPCGDPWVTLALSEVFGRVDRSRCNIALYNQGRWNDFNQLVHAVARRR